MVEQQGRKSKVVYCVRTYRQFADLYDVLYLATSLGDGLEAVSSHYTLAGVSADQAQAFRRKFSEAVSWQ